jgi:hypothetical protein
MLGVDSFATVAASGDRKACFNDQGVLVENAAALPGSGFELHFQLSITPGKGGYLFAQTNSAGGRHFAPYIRTRNRGVKLFYLVQGNPNQQSVTWNFDTLGDGATHELVLTVVGPNDGAGTGSTIELAVDSDIVGKLELELGGPLDQCGSPVSNGEGCITFLGQRAGGVGMTGCLESARVIVK